MKILVDSSIWIGYFRNGEHSEKLETFIDQNLVCTNDLILTELIPSLRVRKQFRVVSLLNSLSKITLEIDWQKIIDLHWRIMNSIKNWPSVKKKSRQVQVPDGFLKE